MTLVKGSRTTIETVRLAWGGDTVGYLPDGRLCFVRGAPIGATIEVELLQSKKKFSRGRMLTSFDSPLCESAAECGGCPWHLSSSGEQRAALLAHTERQLERLAWVGEEADVSWGEVSDAQGWRQTVRFHWHGTQLGYFKWGSHEIVVPQTCPILVDGLERVRVELVHFFKRFGVGEGTIRLTYASEGNGCLISIQPDPKTHRDIDWQTFGQCLYGAISDHVAGIEIRGERRPVYHRGATRIGIGRSQVAHGIGGFVQANALILDKFLEWIVEEVGPRQAVLELFCGSGAITIPMLENGCRILALEGSAPAIENLQLTLSEAGYEDRCVAEQATIQSIPAGRFDVCVLDPPRKGAKEVVSLLKPDRFGRIVYVSCDLGTLVRDLKVLMDAGYLLVRGRLFEMFPNSGHVECVVQLRKA